MKIFRKKMNKGFNLFTALVATVLIVIAVLLTQAMTRKERSLSETISDIEEEQRMLAVADLAKADALEVFNFGIRFAIEEWLSSDQNPADGIPDNTYLLTPDIFEQQNAFEKIKEDFAKTQFGASTGQNDSGTQLATLASRHLTSLLLTAPDVKGYSIDLPQPKEAQLRVLLQKVFNESSKEKNFFTVIDCDGTINGCQKGTFYINLNFRKPQDGGYLSDQEYELFPQLSVTNNLTGRILKQPILPRGNIQIFVPIRLFKALSGALEIAKSNGNGIFEDNFRRQVEEAKAGICDTGTCNARTSLYEIAQSLLSHACFGDMLNTSQQLGVIRLGETEYDPSDPDQQKASLKTSIENQIINPFLENLVEQKFSNQTDFAVSRTSSNVQTIPAISRAVYSIGSQEKTGDAYCTQAEQIEAFIVFEEKNPQYIISSNENKKTVYGIKLFDYSYQTYNEPVGTCTTELTGLEEYECKYS